MIKSLTALLFLLTSCTADSQHADKDSSEITLNEIHKKASKVPSLRSIVISQNGQVTFEKYYQNYSNDSLDHVRSVTKSISGLLIGIAIDKGYIKNVNESIGLFLKDQKGYHKKHDEITIHHLLTMSGGFDWDESNVSTFNNWVSSSDPIRHLLDRKLTQKPGEKYSYNSACSHLLSVIITKASGMNTKEFAAKFLFEPLGITQYRWQKIGEYYNGGAGLELRPIDMVKIGQLVLDHGYYNNQQVISAEWIEKSTSSQITVNNNLSYGYQWTVESSDEFPNAIAEGYAGQFIVVLPQQQAVLVGTNHWRVDQSQSRRQSIAMAQLFKNHVLPYIQKNHSN